MDAIARALNSSSFILVTFNREAVIASLLGGGIKELAQEGQDFVGMKAHKAKNLPVRTAHVKKALDGNSLCADIEITGHFYETHY